MKGAGRSVRRIAGELGIARNTVRRYLKSPEAIRAKPRPQRASKLDPYAGYVDRRLDEGLENCVVLHRELRARGYDHRPRKKTFFPLHHPNPWPETKETRLAETS